MENNNKEYYNYLFYQAVENQSIDLLKSIPKEHISKISTDEISLINYCDKGNLFNIKYSVLVSKDKNILNTILHYGACYGNLNIVKYALSHGAELTI